ncbi:hypothetical protein T484DRAFT_1827351 [Baffinella frigidus]|nr:hypothetical protein T484DRAFT_1827351 [Cryptophyta sp. CCMP2293]
MSGVYGQPKREHWELDYLRTVCAAEGCETRLQMLRRSHCRKCGKLFCPKCVGEGLQRRLNVDADFAERGVFCAVCFECYTQNNGWFSERGSAAWIEASSGNVRDWTEELVRERRSCQAETRRKERLDKNAPFSSTWKAAIALKLAKDLLDVAKGRRRELDPRGKTHWVNARSVAVCDRTACRRAFTLNERRHHCRVCGKVYCDACSPKDLNLTYFLTDPDASGEGGESTGGEEDALASLGEGEQLPLQRGCAGCKRDLERMRLTAHTRRLVDGAGAHVLRNLYHPVSGYVAAIKGAMSSLERSVGYLERMCELAGPQDGDSVHLATADVLELKAELLDLFRKYEKRFGMILKWDGWKYAQLLGEGRPVVDRDG